MVHIAIGIFRGCNPFYFTRKSETLGYYSFAGVLKLLLFQSAWTG